jgi:hypothetical protein
LKQLIKGKVSRNHTRIWKSLMVYTDFPIL